MFKKLECVCVHTKDMEKSLRFYTVMGLKENWDIERELDNGYIWRLVGLKFPDEQSSELVVSNHPDVDFTEIEILVEDVRETYKQMQQNREVKWIREPFQTESGHVAVMEAPDGNVFVLVGR
ncbi:VOC family protein [Bacillus manliponensis]|uniref:VOC family protein n=1 Tax=Bacillus manliponensis TaxID=574376 RepID=UPI003514C89B